MWVRFPPPAFGLRCPNDGTWPTVRYRRGMDLPEYDDGGYLVNEIVTSETVPVKTKDNPIRVRFAPRHSPLSSSAGVSGPRRETPSTA